MFNYSVSWQFILYLMSTWEEYIINSLHEETEFADFGGESQICIHKRGENSSQGSSQHFSQRRCAAMLPAPVKMNCRLTSCTWKMFSSTSTIFSCYHFQTRTYAALPCNRSRAATQSPFKSFLISSVRRCTSV